MANVKISGMTPGTPALDSLVELTNDPSGTPATVSGSLEDVLALAPTAQFVDRGDISAVDFDEGDLTLDGSYYDLDLSSIVPVGATWVLLTVQIRDTVIGTSSTFRKNGYGGSVGPAVIRTDNTTWYTQAQVWVACDENRIIEYSIAAAMDEVDISVIGWIIGNSNYAPMLDLVDRGDISAFDFDEGDLTTDGTWNELDLSSIVPAGATWVLIMTRVWDGSVNSKLEFRKYGSAQDGQRSTVRTQNTSAWNDGQIFIPLDSTRIIEYWGSNLTFSGIDITVLGWVMGSAPASYEEVTITSAGVAASLLYETTFVTTNGDSDLDNLTLADGTIGQIKRVACIVEGNASDTWKVTPANMVGGSQITFAGIGEGCILEMYTSGWVVIGNNGGTIS